MSEEEKKAIEKIKKILFMFPESEELKLILNLIETQQKEIKELKDKYSDEKIRDTVIKRYREVIEKDYISKCKIREKIKRYNEWIKDDDGDYVESLEAQRYALNELLEE